MTQLLADVVAAFERSPTLASTNMLRFDTFVDWARSRVQRALLLLGRLTLDGLSLTRAATLFTGVSSTVEVGPAHPPTLWLFFVALMANGR